MTRGMNRLSAMAVAKASKRGMIADGGGLYLRITASGSKNWIFRFNRDGRLRDMGLGAYPAISLAQARKLATECREHLARGVDPITDRDRRKAKARAEESKALTFDEAARQYIAAHESGWRNEKHRYQWRQSLAHYASPYFGSVGVADIETHHVLSALEPIWHAKPETASRVRGRIEAILDWCKARGLRDGENCARWRGHLAHLLPARSKVAKVKHHSALPWQDVPEFMAELREREAPAARALEFLILTAGRSGEVLKARWDEIDLRKRVWTVPAERMKAGVAHRVPLSDRAVEIIEAMAAARQSDFIFPGHRKGRPLSDMALLMLMRRMGRGDLTSHGFRASLRDWAAEATGFPHEVCEQALAHTISSAVERAYRRGDLFEKRRKLMQAWADFCARPADAGEVVSIHRVSA